MDVLLPAAGDAQWLSIFVVVWALLRAVRERTVGVGVRGKGVDVHDNVRGMQW